jgi:hypothetical protein
VAAASALAGPGDYFDLDQLPLIDPIIRSAIGEPSAPKKRKRTISILEISDSEPEPSILPAPELTDDMEDDTEDEEPAPKRRNPMISNYTPNTRSILKFGKNVFRKKLLVEHAFPSKTAQASLGLASWEAGRVSLPAATACELFIARRFTTHTSLASGTVSFDDNLLHIVSHVKPTTPVQAYLNFNAAHECSLGDTSYYQDPRV